MTRSDGPGSRRVTRGSRWLSTSAGSSSSSARKTPSVFIPKPPPRSRRARARRGATDVWTKPGYEPDRPTPPAENGQRLISFPRGEGIELRVNLSEYQGRPYVSLRVWSRDQGGNWWPEKGKGCSVRLTEA